jgi:hypothetical protein
MGVGTKPARRLPWIRALVALSLAAAPVVLSAAPAQAQVAPVVPAGHVALVVAARYGRDAPLITGGVIWRVYAGRPDTTGVFPLIKEEKAPTPTFVLPPGNYVFTARAPGYAEKTERLQVDAGATLPLVAGRP